MSDVRVGQVWRSNDSRDVMRHKRVVEIGETHATMHSCTKGGRLVGSKTTRIRLDRFRNTSRGYALVKEADDE